MLFKISEYVDVKKKAEQLGFDIPTGIALLPQNFDIATPGRGGGSGRWDHLNL